MGAVSHHGVRRNQAPLSRMPGCAEIGKRLDRDDVWLNELESETSSTRARNKQVDSDF